MQLSIFGLERYQIMRKIIIKDVVPGIYTLGGDGGSGKTALYNTVLGLSEINNKYAALTYSKYINYIDAIKKFIADAELIMLDRCDLYITDDIYDLLKLYSDKRIILLDYKNDKLDVKWVGIELEEKEIVIG